MKKPFVLLKGYKNICALIICIALSVWAICLLFEKDDSMAVFAQNQRENQSLYGLAASLI